MGQAIPSTMDLVGGGARHRAAHPFRQLYRARHQRGRGLVQAPNHQCENRILQQRRQPDHLQSLRHPLARIPLPQAQTGITPADLKDSLTNLDRLAKVFKNWRKLPLALKGHKMRYSTELIRFCRFQHIVKVVSNCTFK